MINLNDEQQKALEKLDYFIRDRTQKMYLLEGFAGTGKTTVITSLFSSRKFFSKDIVLAATTNKAVSVLKNMFAKTYEHVEFKTIHKLCKIKRRINNSGGISFNLSESPEVFKTNKKNIYDYDIIIIDECSMISNNILQLIISFSLKIKGKIIFVGDRYQLPPVNETMSGVFKMPIDSYRLNTIVRCNDKVVLFSSRIRDSIDSKKNISTKNCKCDNFVVFKNSKCWLDTYVTKFDVNNNNILLAYTNNRCNQINKYIRETIYGEEAKNEYINNEVVVFNNFYKETPLLLTNQADTMFISPQIDKENLKIKMENAAVFYTSHKSIISECSQIQLKVPTFPLESLFNLSKKMDVNFVSKKPDSYNETLDCPICFEKIKDKNSIETGCNHVFCEKCIKIWIEQNDQCPYCRMTIKEEKLVVNNDPTLSELINKFKHLTSNQVFKVWKLNVKSNKMCGTIFTPIRSEKERLKLHTKQLSEIIFRIKDHITKTGKSIYKQDFILNRLWEYYYYSYLDLFADISYGYCITVHKSQGSTYDDTYIDCKNILNFNNQESLNCLYTAVTRASKKVNILL